jgi:DNA-binding transcriptional regulator LsrR (DeoR family)
MQMLDNLDGLWYTGEQMFMAERLVTPGDRVAVNSEQHRLLYRIAQSYYVDGLTQKQIANRFGLSRPKVSRLLQKGRDNGIININLLPPPNGMADLEHQLERRFGLQEAVVVPASDPAHHPTVVRELGPVAAECLLRCISGDEVIATAWGTSILAMTDALPYRSWPGVTVVQLLGGLGPADTLEHSAELTQHLARKLGAKLRLLPAPGIVATREMAQVLKSDSQISAALRLAAEADIALVGLGAPTPYSIVLRTGTILTQSDLERLQELGAVGDIALRYLDGDGNPIDLEINERIIGLTIEQIRNIPRVIGIAGGTTKNKMIRAALHGRILDVLVTDLSTAKALLSEEN